MATTTARTYSHTSLTGGDVWYYKVAGVNDIGEGPNSDRANATVVTASYGVTVTASGGSTAVTEGGTTDSYTIVLATAPSANVTVTLSAGADLSLSTSSIVFTSSNWSSAVTVTVTATDDSTVEGTENISITHTATSADSNYNGISISSVTVAITDNDSAGGGGGGSSMDIIPPSNTSISINSGATTTASVNVTLTLGATDVSTMMIANDSAFTSSSWETYATSKSWTLTSSDGTKTVYAKFKDSASNVSTAISDTIILDSSSISSTATSTTSTNAIIDSTSITSPSSTASQSLVSSESPATQSTVKRFSYQFKTSLTIGSTGTEVGELQKALKDLGYFTYPAVTSYFGPITKTALVAYQKAKGLTQSGVLDEKTRTALGNETKIITTQATTVVSKYQFKTSLTIGSIGTEVSELQKALKDLGYFTYPAVTSYFGPITKTALVAYQKAKGLTQSGVLDENTRKSLNGIASVVTTPAVTSASGYTFKNFLDVGSSGEEVKQLQLKLKELGYFTFSGGATGYFGQITKQAVTAFQKGKNLTPYPGYVGPGTRGELNK